jgi:hypothetical protein
VNRILLFLTLAMTASVCDGTDVSLVSGTAAAYQSREEVQHVVLKAEQLNTLSQWLGQHESKWGAHPTEPSSEPLSISLDLTRADGKIDHIAIVAAARGGHYMRLSIGPGVEWAYRSVGGILKTRYAQQPMSERDFAHLRELLFHPSTP